MIQTIRLSVFGCALAALTVISRTAVLPYADVKKRNLRQIAADLSVASVVEGRVQRAGKQVRIMVELVDTQSGRQLWGNQFDFELSDAFATDPVMDWIVTGPTGPISADTTPLVSKSIGSLK